jgi:hypothetical protein
VHHFLGVTVERRPQGLFLHQCQYIVDILERAGVADCKPCTTLMDTKGKVSLTATLRWPIRPAIGVSSGPFSTSSSPAPTSPTPSNRCASICMSHGSHISPP